MTEIPQLSDDTIKRAIVKDEVTREQAMDVVQGWWHSRLMAWDLKRRGRIMDCKLYYVPYWRVLAKVEARMDGKADRGGAEYTLYKREKSTAIGNITWTGIATDRGDIGIEYLKKPDVEAGPYVEGIGPRLEVTVSKKGALDACYDDVEKEVIERTKILEVFSKEIHVMPVDMLIIFYPLWTVRYAYGEAMYPVTVDGMTGAILAGRAPGDPLLRKICLVASIATGIGMVVLPIWSMLYRHDACCAVYIFEFVAFVIVVYTSSYYVNGNEIRRGPSGNTFGPSGRDEREKQRLIVNDLKIKISSSVKIP